MLEKYKKNFIKNKFSIFDEVLFFSTLIVTAHIYYGLWAGILISLFIKIIFRFSIRKKNHEKKKHTFNFMLSYGAFLSFLIIIYFLWLQSDIHSSGTLQVLCFGGLLIYSSDWIYSKAGKKRLKNKTV